MVLIAVITIQKAIVGIIIAVVAHEPFFRPYHSSSEVILKFNIFYSKHDEDET